ncbi:MAG: phosphatase PAP2 family protein [Bifidobacterium sp.]|nr:phosphatase PAP2 family protein [Bifidobacterium sp.]
MSFLESLKKYAWQVVGVLCLAGAIWLTVLVRQAHDGPLPMDTAVYGWIADHLIMPGVTPIILIITQAASAVVLIALCVIALIFLKNKKVAAATCINLACEAVLNTIIKEWMRRPRPDVTRLAVEKGFSFPSGHAMASTAFYGFLIYLIWRYFRNSAGRNWGIALLTVLIPVIMFTRIYVGVHWFSDVLAGCLYSVAWLTLVYIPIMRRTLLKQRQ